MECVNHPGESAVAICTRCDKTLCEACRDDRNGKAFCADCAAFLDQRQSSRPPRAQTGAVPLPQGGGDGDQGPGDVFQPAGEPQPRQPQPRPPQAQGGAFSEGSVFVDPPAAAAELSSAAEPTASGDVYQGPSAVYQGPAANEPLPAEETAGGEFLLFRALLFGAIAGFLAMVIWFQVAMATDKEYGLIALLVGAMVGFGCRLGAGVADERAGLLAAAIVVVAIFFGKYLILDSLFREFEEDPGAFAEQHLEIEYDCEFTEEEARVLIGFEEKEWNGLTPEAKRGWTQAMEAECRDETEGYDEDAYDDYEEYADAETAAGGGTAVEDTFTFGSYRAGFFSYFGFMGLFFFVLAAAEAYKIASAEALGE